MSRTLPLACRRLPLLFIILFVALSGSAFATAWTTTAAGPANELSSWTNGSTAPTTFLTPGDTWTINHAMKIPPHTYWMLGAASSAPITLTVASTGSLYIDSTSGYTPLDFYGNVIFSGGTFGSGIEVTAILRIYGDLSISSGAINNNSIYTQTHINVDSTLTMTGGSMSTGGDNAQTTITAYKFALSAGSVNITGASSNNTINVLRGFSASGPFAISNPVGSSTVIIGPSVTDSCTIKNTSTGSWSNTNVYINGSYTILSGDFSTTTGTTFNGVTVNTVLFCPAPYHVSGTGFFTLSYLGHLGVASPAGINGAITTTGPKTFSPEAHYTFYGTVPQVTGTYMPAYISSSGTVTINNPACVSLSQALSIDGVLAFEQGLLVSDPYVLSIAGYLTSVTGAGAASYVKGRLVKRLQSFNTIFEVGDDSYAPLLLSTSSLSEGTFYGVNVTAGLHPGVAASGLSADHMVNHYWSVSSSGLYITPMVTYSPADILGGTNANFRAQAFNGTSWLLDPLACTNSVLPYTSTPVSSSVVYGTAADYIFGDLCTTIPIAGPASVCPGAPVTLTHATPGGVWSTSASSVATVSATGEVSGVSAGYVIISYMMPGCLVVKPMEVNALPDAGTLTGRDSVCVNRLTIIHSSAPSGTWSSDNTAVAVVGIFNGVVSGISPGTCNIEYMSNSFCGFEIASHPMRVVSAEACTAGVAEDKSAVATALSVYPNPNSGSFAVMLSAPVSEAIAITVTDMLGRVVYHTNGYTNSESAISCSAPQGVYLVTVATGTGKYMAKVVVN